ncbi:MAG: polysaccharide deacetylase family protein [Phycisphaerales bacterium]
MHTRFLPILYYHSVADHPERHPWAFLSTPRAVFVSQMECLKRGGFVGVTWPQLLAHLRGEVPLPRRSVMIHFDDGFLDNWTVVYPIMARLGLKYSVLVSTDFIDPGNEPRPFVAETGRGNRTDWWGYLNAAEMRTMEASGLVDIQSHAKTHTWYEAGPELAARHGEPGVFAPWLHWNRWPERKHAWLTQRWAAEVPAGTPILRHAKSLQARRFLRSAEYDECLDKGMDHMEAAKILGGEEALGRYETQEEFETRVEDELATSKATLENLLKKQILGLVWPGGGVCEAAVEKAKETGYSLISKGEDLNQFGSDTGAIRRLAGTLSLRGTPLRHGQTAFLRIQLARGRSNVLDGFARLVKQVWR